VARRAVLVVDNYDSFVANLARYCSVLGRDVVVMRHDDRRLLETDPRHWSALIVSPGPSAPDKAGLSCEMIRLCAGQIPVLGVCLGHQCIGAVFGGEVKRAREPMHGRASQIRHEGHSLFEGLPNPLFAGRYHSLIVELPESSPLHATAWSETGEIMALEHETHPIFGVQFHPESVLSPQGLDLMRRFLDISHG
jgi:para-aminobenzoate synthetase component II